MLGPRVNKFAVRRKRETGNENRAESGFWYSLSHTVMRRPILTGLPVVLLLVLLALPFLGVSFSLPDDRALPIDSTARIVEDSLRSDFDDTGARSFPVVLPNATADQTTAMAELISEIPEVNQVETSTGTFAGGARSAEPGPPSERYADADGGYLTVFSDVEPVSPEGERGPAGLHPDGDPRYEHSGPDVLYRLRPVDGLRGLPALSNQGGA